MENKKYTANKIAQFLDISVPTLNSWYAFYSGDQFEKPEGMPPLPAFEQEGPHRPRYWDEDALYDLKKFKEWIPRGRAGVMGSLNARNWGDRGKRALENKKLQSEKKVDIMSD